MPISRRPVQSKRRATRLRKISGRHPPKGATVVIRAALVSEETGSLSISAQGDVTHCHIHTVGYTFFDTTKPAHGLMFSDTDNNGREG